MSVTRAAAAKSAASPFAEFIEPFLASVGTISADSKGDYRTTLRAFDTFTQHTSLRDALTVENVSGWVVSKQEAGRPSAAKNGVMHLRRLSRWACDYHYLCGDAGRHVLLHFVAPKVKPKPRRPLIAAELEKIWAWLPSAAPRDAALLRLLLATGVKKDVARTFLREDFVDEGARGAKLTVRDEDPARVLRLDEETANAVRAYFADPGRAPDSDEVPEGLLLTRSGGMFSYHGFSTMCDHLSDEVEIATGVQWTPDIMRVTAAALAAAPLRDVELGDVCATLLADTEHYYRALGLAFQILEKRVRQASRAPEGFHTVELMKYAFGPPAFRLQLSTNDNVRRGTLELYTSVMTFYRNPIAHGDFPPLDLRETRQIVQWVDHLLGLVQKARYSASA